MMQAAVAGERRGRLCDNTLHLMERHTWRWGSISSAESLHIAPSFPAACQTIGTRGSRSPAEGANGCFREEIRCFVNTSSLHMSGFFWQRTVHLSYSPTRHVSLVHIHFSHHAFYPHPPHLHVILPIRCLSHSYIWRQINIRWLSCYRLTKVMQKAEVKERKSFFGDWQSLILRLQNMLWTSLMSLWGQIAYLACAEMPDIWLKKTFMGKSYRKT